MLRAPPHDPPAPGRLHVLIADSYPDAADSLAVLVRLWGHVAQVARTGPEALAAALAHWPHVALVEVALPGMDGYGLALRLQEQSGLPRVRLIAVTCLGGAAYRRRAQQSGFMAYLIKPPDLDLLREVLGNVADTKGGGSGRGPGFPSSAMN